MIRYQIIGEGAENILIAPTSRRLSAEEDFNLILADREGVTYFCLSTGATFAVKRCRLVDNNTPYVEIYSRNREEIIATAIKIKEILNRSDSGIDLKME